MQPKLTRLQLLKEMISAPLDGDTCLEWPGLRNRAGYGTLKVSRRNRLAHRVAFVETFGEIPDGHFVCHKCDNPSCFRPSHLFSGTHTDNMRDCVTKGRLSGSANFDTYRGETNGMAKLTDEKVVEIRKLAQHGNTRTKIAAIYGVSVSMISMILTGKYWTHVE